MNPSPEPNRTPSEYEKLLAGLARADSGSIVVIAVLSGIAGNSLSLLSPVLPAKIDTAAVNQEIGAAVDDLGSGVQVINAPFMNRSLLSTAS